jgi:hypothetical protein
LHFPPPLQVPLQQSEPIMHVSPGCPNIAPGAQQRLLFWVSQLFEQQSVFALHIIDTAAHMVPSPVASPAGLSAAESPDVVPSGIAPSDCIALPSPGGGCESWGDDVSCMPGASMTLAESPLDAES